MVFMKASNKFFVYCFAVKHDQQIAVFYMKDILKLLYILLFMRK